MGGEDGGEMAVDGSIFSYTMAIVITAIIVVSIVFEVVEERRLKAQKSGSAQSSPPCSASSPSWVS